jgi:hypothetical protein
MSSNELITSLIKLFTRDIDKLTSEISLYPDEKSIWVVQGDIKNTAGNLCLHLCGNLQHYIGLGIGQIEYVRNRDREFADKHVPREQLLREIQKTKNAVISSLEKFDPAQLDSTYPLPVFDYAMTHTLFLVHLAGHLNYHLEQINYHRRLTGKN